MSQEPAFKAKKEASDEETPKGNKRTKSNKSSTQGSIKASVASSQSSSSPSELLRSHGDFSYGAPSVISTDSSAQEHYFLDEAKQEPMNDHSELRGGSYVVLDDFDGDFQQIAQNDPESFVLVEPNHELYQQVPLNSYQGDSNWKLGQETVYDVNTDFFRLYSRPKRALLSADAKETTGEEENHELDPLQNAAIADFVFNLSPQSLPERIATSVDHQYISDNLFKIYHDSMENALSCWLNERTCPYRYTPKAITGSDDPTTKSLGEAWSHNWPNRIFQRVQALDRESGKFRDRPLTHRESHAASKALYLVIMAFASQWAQSSRRSKEEHPSMFGNGQDQNGYARSNSTDTTADAKEGPEFDRVLQQEYWNEARKALLECADIESFKVAFANIVFSLTQRPMSNEEKDGIRRGSTTSASTMESFEPNIEGLHDRVFKVIDEDGPPIHLEQGVRHAHSLRHKLQRREREMAKQNPSVDPKTTILGEEERITVDLVAWLGYMLESLTSALHERPLVVADEDCDILPESIEALKLSDEEQLGTVVSEKDGASRLWNDYFFLQEKHNRKGEILRLPCSYEEQAAGLTDAAPIKVLLYRKVTNLQSLFSRYASPSKIEAGIKDCISVYDHWINHYEPFIKDCIQNHDSLNLRIQSWYICLTGHFHLAALLLADVIETIDAAGTSLPSHRAIRAKTHLVAHLRQHNSHMVASLARCATPRVDASFPRSEQFHFALNAGALLTEPWTALLIRGFSKAAVLLLTEASGQLDSELGMDVEIRARVVGLTLQVEDCVRALKYLGRKSDTARLAGDTLDDALQKLLVSMNSKTSGNGLTMSIEQHQQDALAEQQGWGERSLGVVAVGSEWLGLGDESTDELIGILPWTNECATE
jgi:hypothetical protein